MNPDLHPDADPIRAAAALLEEGKLVAFPTETVYGLGADAENPDAVRAIFAAKGRPADHPRLCTLLTTLIFNAGRVQCLCRHSS